jgi:hypothetical protein
MQAKSFFFAFLLSALAVLACLALFNWLLNPIGLFATPELADINRHKPQWFYSQLISKPYTVRRLKPDSLILGTSRAGVTLDPAHPAWSDYRPYNFALPGTSAMVQWHSFQHASAQLPPRRVLLGLDLFMFNACRDQRRENAIGEYMQRLARPEQVNWAYPRRTLVDHASALFSVDGTRKSWRTLMAQASYATGDSGLLYVHANGYWIRGLSAETRQRQVFRRIERQYTRSDWFPTPENCYSLTRDGQQVQIDYLEKLLRAAHAQGTELIMYFSPFHARLAEAMDAVGLWDEFEALKREVVRRNAAVARELQFEAFPLWDFSGFSGINTEVVPKIDDQTSRMHWYTDGTHGSQQIGNLLQDVVYDLPGGKSAPQDFGTLLNPANVEAHLQLIREQRERYRRQFPGDVREVRRLAEQSRHRG